MIEMPADTDMAVTFCCTEYEAGGISATGVGFVVPFDATYRLTTGLNYGPFGGPPVEFGWFAARFYIYDSEGNGWSHYPDYGRCLTNYGSIHLCTEVQLREGDTVEVWFENRWTGTVRISDSSHFEVSYVAGPTDMSFCGTQNGEPQPPVEPEEFITISTDGMSPYQEVEDGTINTISWVAPEDLYITSFCITAVEREDGDLPVLNVLLDGVMVLQLDSGDILDGEFPRCSLDDDLPWLLVTAGQTLAFQNEERGASMGYMTLSLTGESFSLPWIP